MKIKTKIIGLVLLISVSSYSQEEPKLVLPIGHTKAVTSVCFSPDGKYALSGSEDGTFKFWDIASGKEVKTIKGGNVIAISPDNKYMLSGAALWDLASFKMVKIFTVRGAVNSACFSPNGKLALCGDNNDAVTLLDIQNKKILKVFTGHTSTVNSVCFSPDGKYALSGSCDNTMKLWDIISGNELKTFTGHNDYVECVSFSPDGKKALSGSSNSSIKLWDIASGKELKSFTGHKQWVTSVSFSPDGKYAISSSYDNTIKLWDVFTGKEIRTFYGHSNSVYSVTFSKDGRYALSGSEDLSLKLWDVATGKEIKTFTGKSKAVNSIKCTPNGKYIITGSDDNTLKQWDIQKGEVLKTFIGHKGAVNSIDISPYGRYVISGSDFGDDMQNDVIILWDISTGKPFKTFSGHEGNVTSVRFSPAQMLAISGSDDKNLKLWNLATGEEIKTFTGHSLSVIAVDISPNGKYLLSGSYMKFTGPDDNLKLWDIATGSEMRTQTGHSMQVASVCFSPDNKYALSGALPEIILWDMVSGKRIKTLDGHSGLVTSVCFSKDGKYALSGSYDKTVKLWDIASGKEIKTFNGHDGWVTSVCFLPNEKQILSSSDDNTSKLWDIETGKELCTFVSVGKDDWLAITPDGYWSSSNNCGEYFAIAQGLNIWNIDQFAVKNNRPDIVLERLGSEDTELISHFRNQYLKRLRKLKLKEEQLEQGYYTPDAEITKSSQSDKIVNLEMQFADSKYNLRSYNVYVNDVPIYGKGKNITGQSQKINEKVELTYGINKIEVSCFNEKATESYRDVVYFSYNKQVKPNLYFIGFGVSNYKNQTLNLQYAHQDALDLEQTFKAMQGKGFGNIYTKVYTNEQVTTENIKAAKEFLKNAKPDDTFILFIAGHGMHDNNEDATYYYLTYNTDLNNLSGTAANFEFIEDLLQEIPPRSKLFLMDACESGEIDEENDYATFYADASNRGLKSRGFKPIVNEQQTQKKSTIKKLGIDRNRFIYNDLLRRSGAIVFSSSRGQEYSYEYDELQNGLFTEFIIKALTTSEADTDKNGTVSTDELRKYISKEVSKFSGGAQNPTVDRDNIYQKFGFKVN